MAIRIVLAIRVAFGVFLVFQGFSTPQPDLLESRLAQFGDREMTLTEMELTLPFGERFLRPILDRIGRLISSRTPANQQQAIADKINLAGRPFGLTAGSLLALQVVSLVVLTAAFYGIAALL